MIRQDAIQQICQDVKRRNGAPLEALRRIQEAHKGLPIQFSINTKFEVTAIGDKENG